ALTLISVPLGILGQGTSQVALTEGAVVARSPHDSLRAFYARILKPLALMSSLMVMGSFLAPFVFPTLFGAPWFLAGTIAVPVAIMCAARTVIAPVSYVVYIFNLQRAQFVIDVIKCGVVVGTTQFMMLHGASIRCAVWAFAVAMT